MEPQKSIVLPLVLSVLASAIVFGGFGYYLANSKNDNETTIVTPTYTTLPITSTPPSSSTTTTDETANWKTYTSSIYSFSFKYPQDWTLSNATTEEAKSGEIVSLVNPETQKQNLPPGYNRNLVVSYFKDMNSDDARGGSWEGQRTYKSLADHFTDKNAFKQKTGETTVDGKKAYEVTIAGAGSSYGIMIEYNGIYELNFSTANSKSALGSVEKQILSTFKFTK